MLVKVCCLLGKVVKSCKVSPIKEMKQRNTSSLLSLLQSAFCQRKEAMNLEFLPLLSAISCFLNIKSVASLVLNHMPIGWFFGNEVEVISTVKTSIDAPL